MPAPTNGSIETALTASLLAAGFVKNTYVNGVVTPNPRVLPDQLAALVRALSSGDSRWFAQWQAVQPVVINPTAPVGTISKGTLP